MLQKTSLVSLILFGTINFSFSQWTIKNFNTTSFSSENTIKFKNDSVGFLMGNSSIILKTEDSGETWVTKETDITISIKDFQFINDTVIYGTGYNTANNGRLIKSLNSGEAWEIITTLRDDPLYSQWFFNADSGLFAGSEGIYRTVDSCKTWDTVWSLTQSGYKYGSIEKLYFPTSEIGYAIGEGISQEGLSSFSYDYFILKSYDSGYSWDTLKKFEYPLTAIDFVNQDTGFIGTETSSSTILKTVDGGKTWKENKLSDSYNMVNSIHFVSDMIGFASGAPYAYIPESRTSFFISATEDGGETWETYDTTGIPLNSIYYLNDSTGFVSGNYSLIMKSDKTIYGLPNDYPWEYTGDGTYINKTNTSNDLIKIYPNPTNGILYIESNFQNQDIKEIKLLNTSGQILKIMAISGNTDTQIDLSAYTPGIYLIQLMYSDKIQLFKILKR